MRWIYIENTHLNMYIFMFHSTLCLQGDTTVTRAGQDKERLGKIPLNWGNSYFYFLKCESIFVISQELLNMLSTTRNGKCMYAVSCTKTFPKCTCAMPTVLRIVQVLHKFSCLSRGFNTTWKPVSDYISHRVKLLSRKCNYATRSSNGKNSK